MKKFLATILAALMILTATTWAGAEEAPFAPCASIWYEESRISTYTYSDGTFDELYFDGTWPCRNYTTYEFKADGTYMRTSLVITGETYTSEGTWEYLSDTQVQCHEDNGEYLFNYENGVMVRCVSGSQEAVEGFSEAYTFDNVSVFSTDPEGKIRKAISDYSIDENYDFNADENVLKKDLTFYASINQAYVFLIGRPLVESMITPADEARAYLSYYHGNITWLDEETASLTICTNGNIVDVTGTCKPYMDVSTEGVPTLRMNITDEATGKTYSFGLTKHEGEDRETYSLHILTERGVAGVFKGVPTEVYNR